MALAKELAALKLVSYLDLDEEDILKLTTLGNGANSKDTIDTIKKSLVLWNKSYRELMAKCNLLGRGEEKVKEKSTKLKARVQELQTTVEVKESEYLMSHKASKKANFFLADWVIENYHLGQVLEVVELMMKKKLSWS
ncbi:unnamed protein product [Lupinus luteus]|uniref:Uncharacterized protein n=1 Tax=Lupinus luteus TaxID=3873 RepID=A0AAV1YBQ4_LUPLU